MEAKEVEEDYINMEMLDSSSDSTTSSSSIFSTKEFEFQSFSSSSDREQQQQQQPTTTSPADHLFYMGKLLPLHLPPRLHMLHKILQNHSSFQDEKDEPFDELITPLFMTPTANNTPFDSCNVTPFESCQVSRELNPDEYASSVFEEEEVKKKSGWTKRKVKLIKWSSFKSFFTKSSSACSNEYSASTANVPISNAKQSCANNQNEKTSNVGKKDNNGHRRSFSMAFKRLSKPQTSSISNSNAHVFRRSNSSSLSEVENPIQAAIAHCKRSQIANEQREISAASSVVYDDG